MAKQLNVNLGFTADTSQAAAQIQNLQNQLTGLLNSTNGSMNFGSKVVGDVNKASKAIAELKMHLKNATNVNTGTLDFTKLNESISKSGMTLQQYGDKLRGLGPAGQQAFNALANSVAQSEIPIRRSNAALTEMWTTLKNTARWQISSSILHGFMGSISAAVGYAKDLNKSLNDIRIVTGASIDEMARFAEQANRSAKALSASTTEYTKASLIYYQQGLDDQAVKERTDVTIKMANVSGQTAETVSDQMTAVWNNFAKGSEDLERFADVMVRLGADTASSSDEIAQGLEKFAAIGDMVGLSFNNAAAALATVTATTRQSADVVGTAFKTIFARIQGLKLGETLEDGTDLNKYSEALATVGISIKEQNGELKDMDNILAEMGAKWKTLSKDQQVALAQTVAGLRQYNQLVALMENFDFYEQNLQSAATADGSLQEQADIYAESWRAASDRVKAATQGIYEDLLNDEAFIDVLNTIEKILTYIDNLIDGLGGLGGVLTTVGALLTRTFSAQIAQGITSMTNGIKMMTAAGREQAQQQKAQFMKDSADAMRNMSDGSNEGNMRATMMEDQLRLQTSMIENSERMSAEEQQINQMLLDRQRILSDNAIAAAKELDAATEAKSDATFNARVELAQEARGWAGGDLEVQKKNLSDFTKQFNQVQQKLKQGITARVNLEELRKLPVEGEKGKQVIDKIKQAVDKIDDAEIKEIVNSLDSMELNAENVEDAIAALTIRLREMQGASEANMMDENNEWMLSEGAVHGLSEAYEDEATAALRVKEAEEQANEARDNAANSINNATGAQKTWADQMVAGANVVMSLMSALQALSGIIDVATNPDMSTWEKFLSIGSSLAMMFVMLAPLLQGTNLQFLATAAASIGAAVGMKAESVAALEATAATGALSASLWTLLWPIGLVIGAIAILAFAISGLIKLFKTFDEEEKLKKLEEETQNASEAFDRTKEKINETKTALDSLESGYETIEKLKEGTLEWYEAIGNVNAKVMKLVETYPELAQYISSDNGVLKINQQGQDWLDSEMNTRYATAANNVMSTKIREKEKKYEIGKSNYIINNGSKWWTDPEGGLDGKYEHSTQLMEQMYAAPQIGEMLFTTAGAQGYALLDKRDNIADSVNYTLGEDYNKYSQEARDKFIDSLGQIDWKNTDAIAKTANEIFGENFKAVDFSDLSEELLYQRDNMEEFLAANKDHIKEQKELQDSIKKLQDAQFESVLSSMGSTRTADEGKELLGGRTYEDIKAETKTSVEETVNKGGMGGWQDHKNYTGNEKWLQDFMTQMGASDYVAQRGGNMVLKIEGEEKEFSRDEVINTLTDMYSTGAAQEEIKQALIPNIQEAYNIATEGLTAEQLVNLDEMARGIKEGMSLGFEGSEEELNQKVNEMTQGIGKAYGSDTEALIADTSHINFDDTEIQRKISGLTQQLNEGTISAEEFRIAIKEIDAVGELDSLSSVFENAAAAMGGSKDEIAQNAAEMQNYAKHLMEVSKESDELSDELATNADSAADLAVEVTRMNKGVDKLADGIEDWSSVLKKSSKTSQEYGQALDEMRGALADVLDVNADLISNDFMTDPGNLALIEQAAKGSGEAIDALRAKMDEELILNITAGQTDEFIEKVNKLDDVVQDLATNLPDIEVGAILKNEGFLEAANNLVKQSEMTADEANAYFAGIGYEPVYSTTDVENANSMQIPAGGTELSIDHIGWSDVPIDLPDWFPGDHTITLPKITYSGKPVADSPVDAEADMRLTSFSGDGKPPEIKGMRKKASGGMNNYSKSNSGGKSPGSSGGKKGGGGSKSKPPQAQKPPEHKKKSDELERYYEIDNAIEDQTNLLEELAIAKDEAWGADKLKAMQDEIKASKEELALGEERLRQIDEWLEKDKTKVASYGITFDKDGRINNLEEIWEQQEERWYQGQLEIQRRDREYEEAKNADENYDADGKIKLENEKYADQVDKDYDEFMKAVEQYDNTLSEQAKQRLDNLQKHLEIKQQNYEELEYKIELKVELNENDITDIEHQLERLGDNNVYASAERIALIEKNAVSYRNIADIQMAAIKEAEQLYATGQITQTDYMARLQESKEALQEAEMSIRDGIAQIGDELENTFDLVDEKLDQQFTKFDRLIELMDHYKNIVSLTEGEASYKEFNKILKASQEVLRDRIEADRSEVTMWENRRKQLEADIATLPEDSPAKREAEEALQAIMEKEADAKSQLMADIEQLGEYAREIFENSIEQAMKDFEDEMFGRPLNSIIESIEMMNSRQEELLTTTNKIYETNKLIRSVEKDIEATTNNRAKQAYLEFQNKVKQKQEQNELTKFELDLLTAEYEITKAQIALEEAQNAKDTVRLTRDAEGNYGYVYTANEDKVADAEQALEDATNNYYNTALEGAQKYQDQIYQHIQEWEEKVKEVYLDQTLSEEEKNKKIKEINDTYNTLIIQDKNLYYMAVGAMQESAYNTQVDYDLKGIESAKNWFDECDGFLSDLEDAQDEYDRNTEEVSDHTEENFGKMSTAIRNTKQESEYLKDQIVDELVPELDTTLKDSIDNATEAWWKYIEALQEVIRLTDEAMKKNKDAKIIYGSEDYSLTQMNLLKEDEVDWDLLEKVSKEREKKVASGEYDFIDYRAESNNYSKGSIEWIVYEIARNEKIDRLGLDYEKTDLSSYGIPKNIGHYNTGGYTGDWGPEGKLAVLHEKELVLNAEDTKNFLSATGILREISQMLDRDALIASLGAINLQAMTLNSPADQVLQQEVTIHADFPNVTDHNEIEIAIDNLINAASQHAYKA